MSRRLLLPSLVLCVAGCAQQPLQPEPPETVTPVETARVPRLPVEVEAEPASKRPVEPPAPLPDTRDLPTPKIAIVLSDRVPAFENVATELVRLLDDYLLYDLADKSLAPAEVFDGMAELQAKLVIAIGLVASREAVLRSTVPVVFCQVFNITSSLDASVPVRGVASIPPLERQVAVWKQLDPGLEAIGAVLGPGHDALIAEAHAAAAAHGVEFHHRIVSSDRETLFTFQRMAPRIDGFWLFPDNRVLSVDVLEDLLEYASRHDVDVAVFNDGLLEMGATLSATTVEADIAGTALSVAQRILAGDIDGIQWMTPLNDVRIETRGDLAAERVDAGHRR